MKIVLAACSYRYLDKATAFAIAKLSTYLSNGGKPGHRFLHTLRSPDADIARARSQIATDFLELSDCDALLFIDDDIIFNPEDAVKLADFCEKTEEIVCGAYVTKSDPPQLACRLYDNQRVLFHAAEKPVEILYAAGGFTMIHRKVFENMKRKLFLCFAGSKSQKAFYPFFIPMAKRVSSIINLFKKEWEYLSEDFAFCDRARQDGNKIWLDPSVRLEHVGPYRYSLEDLERFSVEKKPNDNMAVTKVRLV